jgi:hypothetical protein
LDGLNHVHVTADLSRFFISNGFSVVQPRQPESIFSLQHHRLRGSPFNFIKPKRAVGHELKKNLHAEPG